MTDSPNRMSAAEIVDELKEMGPKLAAAEKARDAAQAELDRLTQLYCQKGGVLSQAHNLVGNSVFRIPGMQGEYKVRAPRGRGTEYTLEMHEPEPVVAFDELVTGGNDSE